MSDADRILAGVKLAIATPIDGLPDSAKCSFGYAVAMAQILAEHKDAGWIWPGMLGYPADLVRARSRAVNRARAFGATHVLWLDDDNVPAPGTIGAMLLSGHDIVAAPYPNKRIRWERVEDLRAGDKPEHRVYDYSYHLGGTDGRSQRVEASQGCAPIDRIGMGCMMTSMRALDAMTDRYRDELWFTDVIDGKHYDCVALFQLLMTEERDYLGKPFRTLLSEDYSFCERYNRLRAERPEFGPVQMLVSHPADHVGGHRFTGAIEGLMHARR